MICADAAMNSGWVIHTPAGDIPLMWRPFIFADVKTAEQISNSAGYPAEFDAVKIDAGARLIRLDNAHPCSAASPDTDFSDTFASQLSEGGMLFVPTHHTAWFHLMRRSPFHPFIEALSAFVRTPRVRIMRCARRTISLMRPAVMGIWNVSPDSFSSVYENAPTSTDFAAKLIADGADILDIGAESTRPGSQTLAPEQEIERLRRPLSWAKQHANIPISLDSRHPETIAWALTNGLTDIINDVACTAAPADRERQICNAVNTAQAGLFLMAWNDFTEEASAPDIDTCLENILIQLSDRINCAFQCGMRMDCIAVDPGIGFGKGFSNDLKLISQAPKVLSALGRPVLIAHSRKRCIAHATGFSGLDLDIPTAAASAAAFECGAAIVRVHHVKYSAAARAIFAETPHV